MRIRNRDRRTVSAAYFIPNLITTLGLCCGLASLHFSLKGDWQRAMALIVLAGVLDLLDGRAARMLRVTSRFGAQLDSLADFLSFGVAPAMLLHQWMLGSEGVFGLAAVVTFVLCSALRLARYTAAADAPPPQPAPGGVPAAKPTGAEYFEGCPTPASAGVALIAPMIATSEVLRNKITVPPWVVMTLVIGISVLMISRVPMFSLKRIRISRPLIAPVLVVVGLLAVMMTKHPWLTLAGLSTSYLLLLPVSAYFGARAKAKSVAAADAATTPESRIGVS